MHIQCDQKTVDLISPTRFHRHIVAAAAVAMTAAAANASVVTWNANLVIPNNIDGQYINVETQVYGTTAGLAAGWDLNPYGTSVTAMSWFAAAAPSGCVMGLGQGGTSVAVASLSGGTVVGASSTFGNTACGTSAGGWILNAANYFGFRFVASDGLTHYGYGVMTIGATMGVRTLTSVSYESTAGVSIGGGGGGGGGGCTIDTDLDGRPDCYDNCQNIANSNQLNTDGDTRGDACDNCPLIANSSQADCNNNSVGDACEIASGAPDFNQDGIPDTCQCGTIPSLPTCCPGDLDHDAAVGGADIGLLLSNWGPCASACLYDLNNDSKVNGGDLGLLLSGWGPCPN